MEILSPSSSPVSAQQEAANFDELSMQESLLFSDRLKELKNLRSQLYSAAEYFEISYGNDQYKQIVMDSLKDYAVKALVNTVDHLGSVSYKVNGLIDEKVDEVSGAELRVSCIEQRIRTCQEYINREGRSQQSLVIVAPRFHKRYIIPVGDPMPESGNKAVAVNHEIKEDLKLQLFQSEIFLSDIPSGLRDKSPSLRKMQSFSPSSTMHSCSKSPQRGRSPSPSSRSGKFTMDKRAISPLPVSNPLMRSGSLSIRPAIVTSSNMQLTPLESQKSFSMRMHTERNDSKELERAPSKSKIFLKALLSRRRSRKDEMLYNYIDEY